MQLESPHGEWQAPGFWLHAWTSGDIRESSFMYVWAECSLDDPGPVEYRILRGGSEAVAWTALSPSEAVFRRTGYVEEERRPKDADPIGGAERLPAGTYDLELRLAWEGTQYVLTGLRFEVATRDAKRGGWQLRPS